MPFSIDLQKIMARTQILVKNSDFFTNGLILVIHIIYQLLVMIWKLLHHLEHPNLYSVISAIFLQGFKFFGPQPSECGQQGTLNTVHGHTAARLQSN